MSMARHIIVSVSANTAKPCTHNSYASTLTDGTVAVIRDMLIADVR